MGFLRDGASWAGCCPRCTPSLGTAAAPRPRDTPEQQCGCPGGSWLKLGALGRG